MGVLDDYKSKLFGPQALNQHNHNLYRTVGVGPDGKSPILIGGAGQVDAQQQAMQQSQPTQPAGHSQPAASSTTARPATYTYPGADVVNDITQKVTAQQAAATPAPVRSYADLMRELVPKEDPEKIAKQNRRERARKNIAAVSDAISAVANLASTMGGAPNALDPKNSLSLASKARWDEIKKEREKNREMYLSAMLKAAQLDDSMRQRLQNAADLKAYREQQLEDNRLYREALIKNAEAKQQAINENNQANTAIRQQNANSNSKRADAAYNNSLKKGSSGGKKRSSGSGNGSKTVVKENEYNTDGKVVKTTTTTTPGARGSRGGSSSSSSSGKRRTTHHV